MADQGDIRVFNPNKEISKEIILEVITRHRDSMKQARTGEIETEESLSSNERKLNRVRGLNLIISAQREMITISRPIIYHKSVNKWENDKRTSKIKKEVKFEDHDNDYNKIMYRLEVLKACEKDILEAEKTKTLDDDFLISKDTVEGKVFELTPNFYEMLEELEGSYEKIYLLMLVNKIVSSGIEEDEEKSYKEKEQEAIRRVVEA